MNELIKIEVRDNQQLVSGRELHKFRSRNRIYEMV